MDTTILTEEMAAVTDGLGISLRQSEPLVLYHLAREALEANSDAMDLLDRFSQAQATVRMRQACGEVAPEDVERLRALQFQVKANPVIMQYAQTQQSALGYLRQVNHDISELLGTDFGALARRPGCC